MFKERKKFGIIWNMKKITLWIFVAVILALLGFLVVQKVLSKNVTVESRAKVVVPKVDFENSGSDETAGTKSEDLNRASFINLSSDETLLESISMDFDGDGHEDQISAVKTPATTFISLIIAIFDAETSTYIRKATIPTKISQVKTFTCISMDVTGNHKKELVYQGFVENGNSVLQILSGRTNHEELSIETIADFEVEGTIYIQQIDRDESYELGQARGASFPIWVSATEEKAGTNQFDQLQTIYNYSESEKKYIQTSQTRVPQSRLEQRELRRIQDGTVKTFANFLDGIWYKTENPSAMRYIYFDYQNKEIVFLYEDSEEVYSWNNSTIRRNGIYLSTVNSSIENLQRRFDITLVSTDTVRLKLQDDVRMLITESSLWDGTYKKMQTTRQASSEKKNDEFLKALEGKEKWESSEGFEFTFENADFLIKTPTFNEKGILSTISIAGTELLQFRTSERTPVMDETENGFVIVDPNYKNSNNILFGTYLPEYKLVTSAQSATKKQKARSAIYDKNTIILSPVRTSPTGFFKTDGKQIILKAPLEN